MNDRPTCIETPKYELNYFPSYDEYCFNLGKYFSNVHGYSLFGQFVDAYWKNRHEIIYKTEEVDGVTRTENLRFTLKETIVLKESEIPLIQEQFAYVAAAHGWKTGHIDYQFFYSKMCRLSNLWLYINNPESK